MFKTIIYIAASSLAVLSSSIPAYAQETKLDTGDTAWMLTSTALVLLMTIPGLALFYGGMVRKKNVLPTEKKEIKAETESPSQDNKEIKNKEVAESSTQETADK